MVKNFFSFTRGSEAEMTDVVLAFQTDMDDVVREEKTKMARDEVE